MSKYRSPLSHGPGGSRGIGGGSSEVRTPPPPLKVQRTPKVRATVHGRAAEQRRADRAAKQPEPRGRVQGRARERRIQDRERKYVRDLHAQAAAASAHETAVQQAHLHRLNDRPSRSGGRGIFGDIGHVASSAASLATKPLPGTNPIGDVLKLGEHVTGVQIPNIPGTHIQAINTEGPSAADIGLTATGLRGAKLAKDALAARAGEDVEKAAKAESKLSKVRTAVRERPRPVKAARARVAESKPYRAAAESKPGRVASKAANAKSTKLVRKATRTTSKAAAISAPVAAAGAGAHNKGNISGATAPFVGTAKALTHPKTYLTTVEGAPSVVTAPLGMAEGVALTGARAAATASGLKHYSGKEITTPTTKQVGALTDYAKSLASTYGSGDASKIEHATEKDFGLWPAAMVGFPAAHLGKKLHVGERIGEHVPGAVKARTSEPIKESRAGRKQRRREAQQYAQRKTKEARVTKAATHPIQKEIERVKGTKRATHHRGKDVGKKGHVEPGDTLPLVTAEGIDLSHPNVDKHLAAVEKHYAQRPAEATAEDVVPHDVVTALRSDGELSHKTLAESKRYERGLAASKRNSRALEGRDQPYTRAKYFHQAKTWDIKLPEERFTGSATAIKKEFRGKPTERAKAEIKLREKQTADFEKDMVALREGRIKGKEAAKGLLEPHYVRDVKAGEPPVPVAGRPGMEQQSRVMHEKTGAVRASGMQDMSFRTHLRETVARPHKIQIAHEDAARFAAEDNRRIPQATGKGPEVTSSEYKAWAKQNPKEAEKVMLVDRQKYKQAFNDPNITPDEKVRLASEAVEQDQIKRDMANPMLKGRRYLIKPRAKVEEFVAQRTPETVGAGNRIWRWPFHAVLAYSPPWLLSQPIAEGAIAQLSKNLGTTYAASRAAKGKGALPFEKVGEPMSTEARHEVASHAQSTAGTGWRKEDRQTSTKLTEAIAQMKRSRMGRATHDLLTGESTRNVDIWKGGKINEGQFLAKAYHDLGHGPLRRVGKALNLIEPLDAELQKAGGNFAKEMDILSKRPKDMERIADYVYDTHGDWNSIIKSGKFNEKMAAKWLTFYPFLRFSTLWFLRYGRQHPVKAAALSALANNNEQVLRKMYGGGPNFPTGWANAPLYAGTGKDLGKPTKGLGPIGARVSPTSNVLTEQLMSGASAGGALSALNPWVGALVQAGTGINPLSGRQAAGQQGWPGPNQFVKNLAANVGTWPQILREADAATGKKVTRGLRGHTTTQTGLIYDTLSGQATNPLSKAIRDTLGIFLPSDTAKMKQAAEVSRLFARKYGISQDLTANHKAFQAAIKDGNQHDAIDIGRRALLAEQASNRLDLLAKDLGIPDHSWNDAESAFQRAAGGQLVIPLNRNKILEALDSAGIKYPNVPPFRPRKVRRTTSP